MMWEKVRRMVLHPWAGIGLIAVLVSGGLLKIHFLPGLSQVDLYHEYAKALCHFLVVIVLGAALSALVKVADDERERKREQAVFRKSILDDLGESYRTTRSVRGKLRAAGLIQQLCKAPNEMTEDQEKVYAECMGQLSVVHLDLGRLMDEIENFPLLFQSSKELVERISRMEQFIKILLDEYENAAASKASRDSKIALDTLAALQNLSGPVKEKSFGLDFCAQYFDAVRLMRTEVLRVTSA